MDLANVASSGDIQLVRSLLDDGAKVNARSKEGFLPLCNAAFWGYADIVELLLQNGASINLSNSGTGWTACHCAAFQAHGKVLMKLMTYKPDLTIKDSRGRTATDFASALDTIWPFFAAEGCQRTSKTDLIRLGVIRKVVERDHSVPTPTKMDHLTHYSRPGSAYIMRDQSLRPVNNNPNKMSAAHMGDILCLEEEPTNSHLPNNSPNFTLWRN